MRESTIQERMDWEITPELYQTIRALWIKHSKAEDARDLQGLIETGVPGRGWRRRGGRCGCSS